MIHRHRQTERHVISRPHFVHRAVKSIATAVAIIFECTEYEMYEPVILLQQFPKCMFCCLQM